MTAPSTIAALNSERQSLRRAGFLAATLAVVSAMALDARAATNAPTIRLFPTTVVEDLKQTTTVAREMESGLQEVIGRLT